MNLDFALVNRALMNLGMEPLTSEDAAKENDAWKTAKDYYLSTMLEALAQVEWTSAKRRRELAPAQTRVRRHPDFAYVYDLPLDCAKPVELDGHEYFEVEAGLLYANARPARLLYVSNGRRFIDQTVITGGSARRQPAPGYAADSRGRRRPTADYIAGGDAERPRRLEWGDNVVSGGSAASRAKWIRRTDSDDEAAFEWNVPPPPEEAEDFPDYREPRMEPNLDLYREYLLTSKYARRLTDQPGLADVWLQKALVIGRAAEVISAAGSAGRRKAPDSWQEQLGLR